MATRIKNEEFRGIIHTIVANGGKDNSPEEMALIASQPKATQERFWKVYNNRTALCRTCDLLMLRAKSEFSNGVHYFCSAECCDINIKKFKYPEAK